MIVLDFDAKGLLNVRRGTHPWEPVVEIPVRLKIDDIDLLGWESGWEEKWTGPHGGMNGVPLFITDIARGGLLALRQAKQSGRSVLWLGMYGDRGDLLFKMAGDHILVHSTPYGITARAQYEELEQAWREFADKVRQFIVREFPDVEGEPSSSWKEGRWPEWLAGEEDVILPGSQNWSPHYDQYESFFDQDEVQKM